MKGLSGLRGHGMRDEKGEERRGGGEKVKVRGFVSQGL